MGKQPTHISHASQRGGEKNKIIQIFGPTITTVLIILIICAACCFIVWLALGNKQDNRPTYTYAVNQAEIELDAFPIHLKKGKPTPVPPDPKPIPNRKLFEQDFCQAYNLINIDANEALKAFRKLASEIKMKSPSLIIPKDLQQAEKNDRLGKSSRTVCNSYIKAFQKLNSCAQNHYSFN